MSGTSISFTSKEYHAALQRYAASKKGKEALVELDRWYRNELRSAIQSRDPKHVTKEELVKVVRWKLTRGTWRPRLLGYAEAHDRQTVIETTTEAFKAADADDLKTAVATLMKLKGMGAATASAVLAVTYPNVPFMSDGLLVEVCGKKDYTMAMFLKVVDGIRSKVPKTMSIEEYECALWTNAHSDSTNGSVSSKKRKAATIDAFVTRKKNK